MLALIFAAVAAQPQTVTFTHPCAHSSIVLEAFGKQIGETIKPSGSVNKDYFLIRFDEMPIEDAKAAIAKTLNATWSTKGDVLYLTRTRAQELAEENAIDAQLRLSIQRNIDQAFKRNEARKPLVLNDVLELLRDLPSDGSWSSELNEENPQRRLQDKIAATFTVEDLMSLPLGTTYFSEDKQSGDRPIPSNWAKAVQTFRDERDVWQQAIPIAISGEDRRNLGRWFASVVSKFELEFERTSNTLTIMVKLEGRGLNMESLLSRASGLTISQNEWSDFYRNLRQPVEVSKEISEAWNYAKPRWTHSSRESDQRVRIRSSIPRLLAQVINDLPNNEPLTTLVSWPILEAAEYRETNIVALFADVMLQRPFDLSIEKGVPLRAFFVNGNTSFFAQYDEDLSCWMARPRDPAGARKNRMDRDVFGALLRSTWADGWTGLDDAVNFIMRAGAETLTPGWESILATSVFQLQNTQTWFSNKTEGLVATEIYASLTPTQRLQATRGGVEIPLAYWQPGVWPALARGDWQGQRMLPPGLEPYDVEARFGRRVSNLLRQRLPNGTTMRVQVLEDTELWVGYDKTGVQLNLETYARAFVGAELGVPAKYDVNSVAVGPTETLMVELIVPNVGSYEMKAKFERIPFLDELGSVDKLPASARAAVLAAIEKAWGGR
ncbi:MAG: hypothetical protein IH944_12995 [Armatimonadetes bacterium]|nr:hypothetical protein [Armatimonadota bacterium]